MLILGLVGNAGGAGTDVGGDILLNGGPPEKSLNEFESTLPTRVSCQALVMAPVEDARSRRDRYICHLGRSVLWWGLCCDDLPDVSHECPPDLTYDALGLEDRRGFHKAFLGRV